MRVAIYVRVSDESKQKDGFSIHSQKAAMIAYAESQAWEHEVYTEMEGASEYSAGLSRTELGKVMARAREKQIDAILYYKADRFTRDIADGIVLRRELYRLGVKIFCYYPYPHEVKDDSELMNVINDYQSQAYVRTMRENSMRGYADKKRQGLFPAGSPPYGYLLEGKKINTVISIHPEHGKVVEMIYSMFVYYNKSTGEIAKELMSMGILSPGERRHKLPKSKPGTWTSSSVRRILVNRAYTGVWEDLKGNVSVPIPPIVTDEIWNRAQDRPKKKTHGRVYILTGVSRCSCGAHISTYMRKLAGGYERFYYGCGGWQLVGRKGCKGYYKSEVADRAVWEYVQSLILNPELLEEEFHAITNGAYTELTSRIQTLDTEIRQKQEDIESLTLILARTKQRGVQDVIANQVEQAGELLESMINRRDDMLRQKESRLLQMEYKNTLLSFVAGIQEILPTISLDTHKEAIKHIIAMFQRRFVFDSSEGKTIKVYWGTDLEKDIRISEHDTPTHVSRIPLRTIRI